MPAPRFAAAARVALVAAATVLAFNLYPLQSQIITGDDGVWEESWRLEYGWPRRAYCAFGYDSKTRMVSWNAEGLFVNAWSLLGVTAAAFVLTFGCLAARRPVIRDS